MHGYGWASGPNRLGSDLGKVGQAEGDCEGMKKNTLKELGRMVRGTGNEWHGVNFATATDTPQLARRCTKRASAGRGKEGLFTGEPPKARAAEPSGTGYRNGWFGEKQSDEAMVAVRDEEAPSMRMGPGTCAVPERAGSHDQSKGGLWKLVTQSMQNRAGARVQSGPGVAAEKRGWKGVRMLLPCT